MNAELLAMFLVGELLSVPCRAQSTFQNLDFESATIVPASPGTIQFPPAFPGWTGYREAQQISQAAYPSLNAGSSGIALLSSNTTTGPRIAGNYTAVLQAGFGGGVSLAQTGVVPAGTMSLLFLAADGFQGGMMLAVNGQLLNPFPLQNFGNYNEYGADISQYGGQDAELRFTRPFISPSAANLFLDNISFSPIAVPEPSPWALLTLGGALFWCAARRRMK